MTTKESFIRIESTATDKFYPTMHIFGPYF